MAGYKEIVEDWELVEEDSRIEGTRSFYPHSSGTASLPAVGDQWDSSNRNLLCRKRRRVKFFPDVSDRSEWSEKIMCFFSTSAIDAEVRDPDIDQRRFMLGAEIMSIDDPENWYWWQSDALATKTDKVKQPLSLSNIMGSFTRQRILTSESAKDKWISDKLIAYGGTINDREFEGFRIGSVLFNGVSGGTQADLDGDQVWVFDCEFLYRIIRAGGKYTQIDGKGPFYPADYNGSAIVKDDWLYVWRKDASASGQGAWDKPIDKNTQADGNFIYKKTDLSQIFR